VCVCVCVCGGGVVCVSACASSFTCVFLHTIEFLEVYISGSASSLEHILKNVTHSYIRMVALNLEPCKT